MRLRNSILLFAILLVSSHLCAQVQINFDDQKWNTDQSLDSSFVIGNTIFSGSRPFYTNYGFNYNVDNTGIYFVFQNTSADQFKISKSGSKLFNLKSLAVYQVSENSTNKLIIEGWNGSKKVYSSAFSNVTTWQTLNLEYRDINRAVIKLEGTDSTGLSDYNFDNFVIDDALSSVEANQIHEYNLSQNYPNPFNPSTLIHYQIPKEGKVTLTVYDAIGNLVSTLVNEYKAAGSYSLEFNAGNLASGIYIYKLFSNEYISSRKMLLIK